MSIVIVNSSPELDLTVSGHFAALMATDLLMSGVDLTDRFAVASELRAREYSERVINALTEKAIAKARWMKH